MRINFATRRHSREKSINNSVFLCIQWRQNTINLTLEANRHMRKHAGKLLFFVVALLLSHLAFCQAFSYPSFNKSIKAIDNLLSSDWILKDSAAGDLNGDNLPDLVVVTQWKDTIEELRPDKTVNVGSPRILLIFFRNSKTGSFDLVLQHNTFIIRYGEGGMDPEAYGKVSIKNKVLDIFY